MCSHVDFVSIYLIICFQKTLKPPSSLTFSLNDLALKLLDLFIYLFINVCACQIYHHYLKYLLSRDNLLFFGFSQLNSFLN